MNKQFIYILYILFFCFSAKAQTEYSLLVKCIDNPACEKISYQKSFTSKQTREIELQKILLGQFEKGFISASFDSLVSDSLIMTAFLHLGSQYKWTNLKKGNVSEDMLRHIGYSAYQFKDKSFNYRNVSKLCEKILSYYENNGYPFATIKLDSNQILENHFSASLHVEKNNPIEIDSILIKGNAKLSRRYLYNYLSIRPKQLYDESKISKINQRLAELPFIKINKPFQLAFRPKSTSIYIYADKKKASSFDGILGVLPNSQTTGKLMLTGEARFKLLNSFGRAELLDFNWRKIQQSSQDLKFNFVYPFLFSTPFGIDFKFSLYKQDSSYINLSRDFGIQYIFSGNNYLKCFVDNRSSNLISTFGMESITVLPPWADISCVLYGLETRYEKLDYRMNPRKGFVFLINGAAGNKIIKKNSKTNPTVYDSLKLKSSQYKYTADADFYIPLFTKTTIKLGTKNGALINDQLFENELYRIGGMSTLRGFDEESIYASLYSIITVEYRFLFERNSYLNLFWNGAYYENKSMNKHIIDRPYGFGAGISFETKPGIFSISYALGKQFDNPVYFKQAKIHFGIVSYF